MRQPLTTPLKILISLVVISFLFAVITSFMKPVHKTDKNQTQPVVETQKEPVLLVQDYQVTRTEPFPQSVGVSSQTSLKVVFNKSVQALKADLKIVPSVPLDQTLSKDGTTLLATAKESFKAKATYTVSVYLQGNKFYQWQFTTR